MNTQTALTSDSQVLRMKEIKMNCLARKLALLITAHGAIETRTMISEVHSYLSGICLFETAVSIEMPFLEVRDNLSEYTRYTLTMMVANEITTMQSEGQV